MDFHQANPDKEFVVPPDAGKLPDEQSRSVANPTQDSGDASKLLDQPTTKKSPPEHVPYSRLQESRLQLKQEREQTARLTRELEALRQSAPTKQPQKQESSWFSDLFGDDEEDVKSDPKQTSRDQPSYADDPVLSAIKRDYQQSALDRVLKANSDIDQEFLINGLANGHTVEQIKTTWDRITSRFQGGNQKPTPPPRPQSQSSGSQSAPPPPKRQVSMDPVERFNQVVEFLKTEHGMS